MPREGREKGLESKYNIRFADIIPFPLANWFTLSDEGVEDAIYDSYAFRKFMKVDFLGEEQVPDATTLCRFRKLLNEAGITKLFFDEMKAFLDRHGKLMHGGTIVDATIIDAPTSQKMLTKSVTLRCTR